MSVFLLIGLNFLLLTSAFDNSFYYKHWCGQDLRYLHDANCQKLFPSSYDRDWTCPTLSTSKTTGGYLADSGKFSDFHINTTTLEALTANNTNACVILIKRPASGKPVYKYFCAPGDDANAHETWYVS